MTKQINFKKEFITLNKNGNTKVISTNKANDLTDYINFLMEILLKVPFIKKKQLAMHNHFKIILLKMGQ